MRSIEFQGRDPNNATSLTSHEGCGDMIRESVCGQSLLLKKRHDRRKISGSGVLDDDATHRGVGPQHDPTGLATARTREWPAAIAKRLRSRVVADTCVSA